jgi:hypothetical protein
LAYCSCRLLWEKFPSCSWEKDRVNDRPGCWKGGGSEAIGKKGEEAAVLPLDPLRPVQEVISVRKKKSWVMRVTLGHCVGWVLQFLTGTPKSHRLGKNTRPGAWPALAPCKASLGKQKVKMHPRLKRTTFFTDTDPGGKNRLVESFGSGQEPLSLFSDSLILPCRLTHKAGPQKPTWSLTAQIGWENVLEG